MHCFACVVAQAVDLHVSLLVSLLYLVVHACAGFLVDACAVLAVCGVFEYVVDGRACQLSRVIVLAVDARAGFFIVMFVDARVRVIVVAVDARSSLCTHCVRVLEFILNF